MKLHKETSNNALQAGELSFSQVKVTVKRCKIRFEELHMDIKYEGSIWFLNVLRSTHLRLKLQHCAFG